MFHERNLINANAKNIWIFFLFHSRLWKFPTSLWLNSNRFPINPIEFRYPIVRDHPLNNFAKFHFVKEYSECYIISYSSNILFFKNALLYYILVWVKQKCCVSHRVNTCTIISNFDTSHTWWWRKGPSGPIFTKNCEVRTVHLDHYKSIVGQEFSYSAILHSTILQ